MRVLKRAVAVATAVALTAIAGPAAAQGFISGTRHNFSNPANPVYADPAGGEDGICVFCHTPHKGETSLLLWNHRFPASTYAWSDATNTTNGTSFPTNIHTWAGSTRKCLSCHDATISIGAIYWSNATANPNVPMLGPDQTGGVLNNSAYTITGRGAGGGDMAGNHPVAVPFPNWGGGGATTYNAITSGVDPATYPTWVQNPSGPKIFGAGGAGGPAVGAAGIECASCHDPHGTANTYLLRVTKSASQLCLRCHNK